MSDAAYLSNPSGSRSPVFNPFKAERGDDPYALYERLRAENPVHVSATGELVVTLYAQCHELLRDPRLSSSLRSASRWSSFRSERRLEGQEAMQILDALWPSFFIFHDPPEHTRLRGLVNRAFTPRATARLHERIAQLVEDLLDPAIQRGSLDVVADLADPLPVSVLCELLGIPPSEHRNFKFWTNELSSLIEYPLVRRLSRARGEALVGLVELLRDLIEARRSRPEEDLLSGLVQAECDGNRLTEFEILGIIFILLLGGQETTRSLIGTGTLALADNPAQADRLREEPELISTAVEEMVRYRSPIQYVARVALEEMEVGGLHMDEGQQVVLLLACANRDEAAFVDASRFVVDRKDNRHLGFGFGPHFCIGSSLGRLQTKLATRALLRRLPVLEIAGEPRWRSSAVLCGLEALAVGCP